MADGPRGWWRSAAGSGKGWGARLGARAFPSLRGYRLAWLPRDAVAGIMLLAIAVPGQLATARLAGMPPESGLLAFVAGSVGFALVGANRFASVAADSTIAPIFAATLAALAGADPARYGSLAALFALLVGIILVMAGWCRAGWIADLLSVPVTVGFLAGIAVHIVVGQLPGVLGITVPPGPLGLRFLAVVRALPATNPATAAIAAGVLGVTLLAQRTSVRIPGALIGLVAAGLAVALFGLERKGVAVLGALNPLGAAVRLPRFAVGDAVRLLPLALTVAVVCMMQTAAVVRSFPSDPDGEEDVSGDFTGVGAGNIVAALVGAFAVDASPPSTAIVAGSGGRSQAAELLAAAAIVVLVALAGRVFMHVPMAALGAVLVFIAMQIFRLNDMIAIARRGGSEILLVAASAGLVVALPIEVGVGLSVVLSLLQSIYRVARPACTELARIPGTTIWWAPSAREAGEREPGVLVFAPAAPINFTNANYVRRRLTEAIAAQEPPPRLVVIDASGVDSIDYTGAMILRQGILALRGRGIEVAVARLAAAPAQRSAALSGLLETLGGERLFHSAEEAVRALRPPG